MENDQKEELKSFTPPTATFFIILAALLFSGIGQEHFDLITFGLAFIHVAWMVLIYYSNFRKTRLFYVALVAFCCFGFSAFVPLSRSIEGFGPLAYVLIIGWMSAFFLLVDKANLAFKRE